MTTAEMLPRLGAGVGQALGHTDLVLRSVESTNADTRCRVEVRAERSADQRDDKQLESASWQADLPAPDRDHDR